LKLRDEKRTLVRVGGGKVDFFPRRIHKIAHHGSNKRPVSHAIATLLDSPRALLRAQDCSSYLKGKEWKKKKKEKKTKTHCCTAGSGWYYTIHGGSILLQLGGTVCGIRYLLLQPAPSPDLAIEAVIDFLNTAGH
jgi:hypothetical protein